MAKKQPKRKDLNKRLKSLAVFLVKLNLLAIPLYAIIYYNLSFVQFQDFVATIAFYLLKIFGYNFSIEGHSLFLFSQEQFVQVDISWDSSGWKSLYVLSALVAATPSVVWKRKLKFLAFALPTLFTVNIVRILTTIIVSLSFGAESFEKYFDFMHLFLWSSVSIITVLAMWYVFLRMEKHNIREK